MSLRGAIQLLTMVLVPTLVKFTLYLSDTLQIAIDLSGVLIRSTRSYLGKNKIRAKLSPCCGKTCIM